MKYLGKTFYTYVIVQNNTLKIAKNVKADKAREIRLIQYINYTYISAKHIKRKQNIIGGE
ncbi:MAG: hypothetical protein ISS13_01930 [Actinobacteria bacterium]|nr:hypothetical protein [Actinomycetota bacterium]